MPRKRTLSWETENTIFATRLREIMEIRKIIQYDLARETGIQRQTISNYMNGQSRPDTNNLLKICKALNVSADYLIGATDVISLDHEMRAMCEYTKLDESAVRRLNYLSKLILPGSPQFPIGWQYMKQLGYIILDSSFTDSMDSIFSAAYSKAGRKQDVKLSREDSEMIRECNTKLIPIGYGVISDEEASELYRDRAIFSMNKAIERVIDIVADGITAGMDEEERKAENNG
ncbi:MAG: helix-turn-helix domain-containing protein [Faecousia sp.]